MAIYPLLRGNSFVSRLKSLLTLQRLDHTLQRAVARAKHSNHMDSDSLFVQGRFDFAKCRKMDSRTLGITSSMISAPSQIVLKILKRSGFEAYLVGGCVRDLILNKKPKDFDVITTAKLKQIRKKFHRADIIGRRFPICIVHIQGSMVEVSSFETLPQHEAKQAMKFASQMPLDCDGKDLLLWRNSMRRDFTINSLFFDPFVNKIYDCANGLMDLSSLKLKTLIPAQLSFKEDCARILRGLRIAARIGLSFSKETETAMHELSSSVGSLSKPRIMMELNYMLSYGAAEPSLGLLQRFNLLAILLPFHAAYFSQQASYPSGQRPIMLMKLFSHLDRLVACDRPSDCSLWVGLLAFHLALVKNPQDSLVVLTFASVLYHGEWKKGVEYAKQHTKASPCFLPEILENFDFISDDELTEKVTQLALLVKDSIDVLIQTDTLLEAMARFPDIPPCSGLVFVSKNTGRVVAKIFDGLAHDVETYATQKENAEIDYNLLGKGDVQETRFTIGKIIIDTLGCGAVLGVEVKAKDNLLNLDHKPMVQVFEGNCQTPFNSKPNTKKRMTSQFISQLEQETEKRQNLSQKKSKILKAEIKKLNPVFSKSLNEFDEKQDSTMNREVALKHEKVATDEIYYGLQEGMSLKNEISQLPQKNVQPKMKQKVVEKEITHKRSKKHNEISQLPQKNVLPRMKQKVVEKEITQKRSKKHNEISQLPQKNVLPRMKQKVVEKEITQKRSEKHLLGMNQCQISQNDETEKLQEPEPNIKKCMTSQFISQLEQETEKRQNLSQNKCKILKPEIKKLNAVFSRSLDELDEKQDSTMNTEVALKHEKVATDEIYCGLQEGKSLKNEISHLLQKNVLPRMKKVAEKEITQKRSKKRLLGMNQCQISQNDEIEKLQEPEPKIQVAISQQEGVVEIINHLNQRTILAKKNGKDKKVTVKDKSILPTLSSLFK